MKKRVTRLICKFGVQLCAVAAVIAPLIYVDLNIISQKNRKDWMHLQIVRDPN